MNRISYKELHRHKTTKLIQSVEELFKDLGFNDLVESGVNVEIYISFFEVFNRHVHIVNPEGGGERFYDIDAIHLLEFMYKACSELYASVTSFREEFFHNKTMF